MVGKAITIRLDNWVVQVRAPEGDGPFPVLLSLHGWTGDESAMGVFSSRLPAETILIAPRGLYPTPLGGYGWHPHRTKVWPWVDDFNPAIQALRDLLNPGDFPKGDFSDLGLVGFSQGAALAYAYAFTYPQEINVLAGLSGFLAEGSEALARNKPLLGKPVFVTHGSQDELVPVWKARRSVEILELAGAHVTYCEDDVGHKLSANCYRGLEMFFVNLPC